MKKIKIRKACLPWIAFVVVLCFSTGSFARNKTGPVILIALKGDDENMKTLHAAVRAQVSDFDVEVLLKTVEDLPGGIEEQLSFARRLTSDLSALCAIWLDKGEKEVFLYVEDQGNERFLFRNLPGAEGSWEVLCDAIGLMIRSMLAPWLLGKDSPLNLPVLLDPEVRLPTPPQLPAASPSPPKSEGKEKKAVMFGFNIAYATRLMYKKGQFLHGMFAGAGFVFSRFIEVGLGISFLQISREVDNKGFKMRRWPLRLRTGMRFSSGRFAWGAGASFVVDMTFVDGPDEETTGKTNVIYPGAGPDVFACFRALSWMEIRLDLGFDTFFSSNEYIYKGNTVFSYAPAQPRATLGMTFFIIK